MTLYLVEHLLSLCARLEGHFRTTIDRYEIKKYKGKKEK